MYHSIAVSEEGSMYSWGRGLYGVLGNASNNYSLEPELNEEIEGYKEEGVSIVKVDAADEFTGLILSNGGLYAWGKNDRGQLGIGSGIGIDMVESCNQPTFININEDGKDEPEITNFSTG